MSTEIPPEIIDSLRPLFEEAEEKGLWFYSTFNQRWYSPNELRAEQENGNWCWNARNWKLGDPKKHLEELRHEIDAAIQLAADFEKRMKESK